tara:strand:- start:233 stop:463 length:231 start_codon:yes stop_codon:yes gene_type:complete
MSKIRKLTPSVLKQIISEEKQKLATHTNKDLKRSNNVSLIEAIEKLAIKEAELIREVKQIRAQKAKIKNKLAKSKR